jgi:hypothetical protein
MGTSTGLVGGDGITDRHHEQQLEIMSTHPALAATTHMTPCVKFRPVVALPRTTRLAHAS